MADKRCSPSRLCSHTMTSMLFCHEKKSVVAPEKEGARPSKSLLDEALGLDELLLVLDHFDLRALSRSQSVCRAWRHAARITVKNEKWQRARISVLDIEAIISSKDIMSHLWPGTWGCLQSAYNLAELPYGVLPGLTGLPHCASHACQGRPLATSHAAKSAHSHTAHSWSSLFCRRKRRAEAVRPSVRCSAAASIWRPAFGTVRYAAALEGRAIDRRLHSTAEQHGDAPRRGASDAQKRVQPS
jgi:hypothetical protein